MTGNGGGDAAALLLSKHEGAGNDFLVVVATGEGPALGPAVARALCDRHRGVGADGLVLAGRGTAGADLSMRLWNADGSEAEMSGNGIRCLAQAAVEARLVAPPRFTVATVAGVREIGYHAGSGLGEATASVEMGRVRLGADRPATGPWRRAVEAGVGNPHLVVLVESTLEAVDLPGLAASLAAGHREGVNVEVVVPGPGPDQLALRVWERGVGETLACGTGSCAAAAAARRWGLVGDLVQVANPGGVLEVRLGPGDEPEAVLGGPVRKVAEVRVDPGVLERAGAAPTHPAAAGAVEATAGR